jgi:hypothetical protein
MHKTLTSVVALAGLAAAAGVAQAEDAVVAGDTMELSLSQMDEVTAAGDRVCFVCTNVAVVSQYAAAIAGAYSFFGFAEADADAENESDIDQDIN